MAEGEDVVRVTGSVGVVLLDLKIGLMIEQTIQNMRGVTHRGTDRPRMERRVTIRDVSVEHHYRIAAILGVHLSDDGPAESDRKRLPIRRRRASTSPPGSERDVSLELDDR